MLDYRLDQRDLAELRVTHRVGRDLSKYYWINAVILQAKNRTAADVADSFLIDPDTVCDDIKRYKKGVVKVLLWIIYIGSEALLNDLQ